FSQHFSWVATYTLFLLPEHKYEIVKRLQARKHICGMTGDGVNDAPALKKADIGIAVADATDAARSASDIVLTEPGLSVIISAVLTSRAIFQRMKNYTVLYILQPKYMQFPLQSVLCQALIFVTRSRSWSFVERPGFLLVTAFLVAQLIATLIAVYADWSFSAIKGIGWGW
ncbi:hypothetical protein B296_00059167, partial [Ensete ventricosum]